MYLSLCAAQIKTHYHVPKCNMCLKSHMYIYSTLYSPDCHCQGPPFFLTLPL